MRARPAPRARALLLTGLLTVVVGVTAPVLPASAYVQCPASADVFVWDGSAGDAGGPVGDGTTWDDAYNWDQDCTPGLRFQTSGDGYDDSVTIPAGASVVLRDGESAHITRLTNLGTLTLTPGARLVTSADSTSSVLVLQGLLAGTGRFTVTSRLDWVSTSEGAATQSTRECTSTCSAAVAAGGEGTTVVAPAAQLRITGRGVNLADQRVIENHGTVVLSGSGYVAADAGTRFRNVRTTTADPVPRFLVRNDGGWYQGFSRLGLPRSAFSNGGQLVKDVGTGLSIVDAAYTATDPGSVSVGAVTVTSGTLSILGQADQVRSAQVLQGRTFANGGCTTGGTPAACTTLRPTAQDQQITTVQLTRPGTTLAKVTVRELPQLASSTVRGVPVQIDTPGALATTTSPLRFRLLLDASLVGTGETAAGLAQTAPVQRQGTTSDPYTTLPSCGSTDKPTTTRPSCVSRALSVSETNALGSGDVVLVVSSLQNSRYRIGR